jgi:putative FmdB family regulatory protein
MPLYEFVCRGCGHRFEELTSGSSAVLCPRCQSEDLQRQFSVFAIGRGVGPRALCGEPAGACAQCGDARGPGSCALD